MEKFPDNYLNYKNVNDEERHIKQFYKDANILITGGSGFLGKALIEKLLRSCNNFNKIHILMRSKQGKSSEYRFKELLNNSVFDRIRKETPDKLEKIHFLSGDITEKCLGLSSSDLKMIIDTVNIVFHSAATVKFNEGLKEAGNLNTCGTQRLMDICSKMTYLKSFVHVSTAYCNPGRKYVKEIVYPVSPPIEKESFMKCINNLPEEVLTLLSQKVKGAHPNTYTLTKSIAEQVITDYQMKFPISIIRPSIVTASIKEPYPGWVDNVQGITGIMMEISRGTITTILGDKDLICDIIPVDIVVNTMIAAAWFTANLKEPTLRVYNCTSGQIKPITWHTLGEYTVKWARINPSKYVMLYPNFSYRRNELMHDIITIIMHYLPAIFFDLIMTLQGTKPIMMKIARKFKNALYNGSFFSLHEWIFDNKNQKLLAERVNFAIDGDEFNCTIEHLDYDDYIRKYVLGIRKYVLKDGDESIESARIKLSRIFWLRLILPSILLLFVMYMFYSYLCNTK